MPDSSKRLEQTLIEVRDIAGISAEYLMTFLKRFKNEREQLLVYSLCCNFHRVEHCLEIELIHLGVDISSKSYAANAFRDVSYIDIDFVETITNFLKEKEINRLKNKIFPDI
ncbi:hypothetical protein [Aliikangiella sp. IMCC44359]|uniref:hypothetical protein n=1 Tax=Aliikangiella sp. IMCC44359 TaxID=3459125 RepID=UPI00403B0AB0